METVSVRFRHRPLRVGLCVEQDDFPALRSAMRAAFALWGGCFNPIIPIGDMQHADRLIRLYRVDALLAVSATDAARVFAKSRPELPWPGLRNGLFNGDTQRPRAQVADLTHPIARLHDEAFRHATPFTPLLDLYEWSDQDPLADVFLATYGAAPDPQTIGLDYGLQASARLGGQRYILAPEREIVAPNMGRYAFADLSRAFVERHYAVQNQRDDPGFYVGDASNFDDLVHFWNLRAADIAVHFHDPRHADRTAPFRRYWADHVRQAAGGEPLTLWGRDGFAQQELGVFGQHAQASVSGEVWNGFNLAAPVMYFDQGAALGSLARNGGRTTLSFALGKTPFVSGPDTDQQAYVLSTDPGIGIYGDERTTLHTPFLPALNLFYGREATWRWNAARAEPGSLGLVTNVSDNAVNLAALDVAKLIAEIFKTVGIDAAPSGPGRVASTLINKMGGLDGCRPFKIAGVRRLIGKHRPDQSFSRSDAMQTINGQGQVRSLDDYQWLHIERRDPGAKLTNASVLSYLLDREVFRAGLKFTCPSCELEFWRSLDEARNHLECEYCGHGFNAARQLRDKDWAFRRSGLFGRDDDQQGSLPVILTLPHLIGLGVADAALYTTALELKPQRQGLIKPCETDFVVVRPGRNGRLSVAIGECKNHYPISADDVANLDAVAKAFPTDRFEVFIVFSRISPFTPQEIDLIRPLNEGLRQRVILFTERELEPYDPYDRTKLEFDIDDVAVDFSDMARITDLVFFENLRRDTLAQGAEVSEGL